MEEKIRQILREQIQMNPNAPGNFGYGGVLVEGGYRTKGSKNKKPRKRKKKGGVIEEDMQTIIEDAVKNALYGRKQKDPNRVDAGKRSAKENPWIKFVKKYKEEHPNLTHKQALMEIKSKGLYQKK